MLRSARLRHRIAFERQMTVRNSEGIATLEWLPVVLDDGTELDSVPAEVLTGPGREGVNAGQRQHDIVARIMVRWFPGLSANWRILWLDDPEQVFSIATWSMDRTARREYRIDCRAGKSEGL